jgi:hypothetical protein
MLILSGMNKVKGLTFEVAMNRLFAAFIGSVALFVFPSESFGEERGNSHQNLIIEKNDFKTSRGFKEYLKHFGPYVAKAIMGLGPKGRWADLGAGAARAQQGYLANCEKRGKGAGTCIAVSAAMPADPDLAANLKKWPRSLKYVEGFLERIPIRRLGGKKFHVTTDEIGPFSYAMRPDLVLTKTGAITEKNGIMAIDFLVSNDTHGAYNLLLDSKGRSISWEDYFSKIQGVEILDKTPFTKTHEDQFRLVLRKTGTVKPPKFEVIDFVPGRPPFRILRLVDNQPARKLKGAEVEYLGSANVPTAGNGSPVRQIYYRTAKAVEKVNAEIYKGFGLEAARLHYNHFALEERLLPNVKILDYGNNFENLKSDLAAKGIKIDSYAPAPFDKPQGNKARGHANLIETGFKANSYDTILATRSIFSNSNVSAAVSLAALKEVERLLKPGGKLLISPLEKEQLARIQKYLKKCNSLTLRTNAFIAAPAVGVTEIYIVIEKKAGA